MNRKTIRHMIIAAALLSGQISYARNFYQIKVMMDLTYTNIGSGTSSIIKNLPIQVRYSDDEKFCRVYGPSAELACNISESSNSSYLKSYMNKQSWLSLFSQFESAKILPVEYNQKLTRILNQCEKCNYFISDYRGFVYQIDDSQPEAFHLFIHDMTKPELL